FSKQSGENHHCTEFPRDGLGRRDLVVALTLLSRPMPPLSRLVPQLRHPNCERPITSSDLCQPLCIPSPYVIPIGVRNLGFCRQRPTQIPRFAREEPAADNALDVVLELRRDPCFQRFGGRGYPDLSTGPILSK